MLEIKSNYCTLLLLNQNIDFSNYEILRFCVEMFETCIYKIYPAVKIATLKDILYFETPESKQKLYDHILKKNLICRHLFIFIREDSLKIQWVWPHWIVWVLSYRMHDPELIPDSGEKCSNKNHFHCYDFFLSVINNYVQDFLIFLYRYLTEIKNQKSSCSFL